MGFLGVRFEVVAVGGITPSKTRENYAGNFKFGTQVQTHVNSENIAFSTQTLKN